MCFASLAKGWPASPVSATAHSCASAYRISNMGLHTNKIAAKKPRLAFAIVVIVKSSVTVRTTLILWLPSSEWGFCLPQDETLATLCTLSLLFWNDSNKIKRKKETYLRWACHRPALRASWARYPVGRYLWDTGERLLFFFASSPGAVIKFVNDLFILNIV